MEKSTQYDAKKQYEIVLINGANKVKFIKKGNVVRQFVATHRGHYDKIQITEIAIENKVKDKKDEISQPAVIDNNLKN
jgi:hypothetical protein